MTVLALPRTTTDVAALRRQLDEERRDRQRERESADERNAKLHALTIEQQRQIEDLQRVLINHADDIIKERGVSFWAKAFDASRQRNAKLLLEIDRHKRWHLEDGREAERLQALVAERDQEIGELTRALDLARAGERCFTEDP